MAEVISEAGKLGSIAVTLKSPLVNTGVPVLVPPMGEEGVKTLLEMLRPEASTTLREPDVVVPSQDTEISVFPPSSRRSLFST